MNAHEISILYAYNDWANRKVIAAAGTLSEDQIRLPAPVSHGSLLGTLAHVISAEWIWRTRCQEGVSPSAMLSGDDFSNLAGLRHRWEEETAAMQAYVRSIRDAELERRIRYTNTKGFAFETPLWQILLHVVNHGTQFRGEAAVLLTQYGASPGDLDFIAYLRI